jgi:serine/threonine-protein kinase HipA
MPLLLAGAFNPIGRLRIGTAVEFYEEQLLKNPDRDQLRGFEIDDILANADDFLEHLSLHAMLSAGTTGVQGVAPKFLLAQDQDGLWFADLALPDARARRHWIVKLPRGRTEDDLLVHRHEAAYLRLAAALGLRTQGAVEMRGRMLFTERFDRMASSEGVTRLHQESLASLAGLQGFGAPTTQNQLLSALRVHATHPATETLEFLKRDVFNLAMRNTDNHARNTAVQELPDGTVQLTPVFDVSPMFRDPDLIPRSVHWRDADGRRLDDWREVLDNLQLPGDEQHAVVNGLQEFATQLERVPNIAADHGVEPVILEACLKSIEAQIDQLRRLSS